MIWWLSLALAADVQIVGTQLQLLDHAPRLTAQWADAEVVYGVRADAAAATTLTAADEASIAPYRAALPSATWSALNGEALAPVVVTLGTDLDPTSAGSLPAQRHHAQPITVVGFVKGALVFDSHAFGCCGSEVGDQHQRWIAGPVAHTPFLLSSELSETAETDLATLIQQVAAGPAPDSHAAQLHHQLTQPPGRHRGMVEATKGMAAAVADTGRVEVHTTFGPTLPTDAGRAFVAASRECPERVTMTLAVPSPKGRVHTVRVDVHESLCANMTGEVWAESRVSVWWSADGAHAVAAVDGYGQSFGFRTHQLVHLPVARPAVEVVHRTTPEAEREALTARLVDAGFALASPSQAVGQRQAVQVFARKGFEADGAELAALVGAAKAEPLTWDAAGDLVVALP